MIPEDKEFEPDDPMELVGVEIPESDSAQALDDIVMEYLFMGWKPMEVLFLFKSPYYGATHQIYRQKGHEYVKRRILHLAEQWEQGWIKRGEQNGNGV